MLLIIGFHATRNGYLNSSQPIIVYSSGVILGSWGLLGVDLFLIISAWFLSSQQFRIKKVIYIVFQTFTWVVGYSGLYILYDLFYNKRSVIETVFDFCKYSFEAFWQPMWCSAYWFITTYIFMLLISPLLNKLLNELSQNQIQKILWIFVFVPVYSQFSTSVIGDVFRFLYVYLLIGYIKKYGSKIIDKFSKPIWCICAITSVVFSSFVIYFVQGKNKIATAISYVLTRTFAATGRHSIIMLICAVLIFFTVLNKKERHSKVINTVASSCLGVYLFHENDILKLPNTLNVIFGKLTVWKFLEPNILFPVKYLSIVVGVFAVGAICETIRVKILQKPFMKTVDKKYSEKLMKVDNWFNSI